ncbi:MAG: hypothetical protein ACLSD6_05530 [Clostridium sp.]
MDFSWRDCGKQIDNREETDGYSEHEFRGNGSTCHFSWRKAFRGKQLFQWVHEKQADDFDEMTNLSLLFGKIKEITAYRCETGGKTGVEKKIRQSVYLHWKMTM